MNFVVYIRSEAQADIENAATWYEKQKKNLGNEFLNEILKTCDIIAENPNIYPIVYKRVHRAVLNRFPFGIYYLTGKETIIVIAIMHGSRHPQLWKTRA